MIKASLIRNKLVLLPAVIVALLKRKPLPVGARNILGKWLFILSILLFIGYVLLAQRENIFTVNGDTQSITMAFSANNINQWNVSYGKILLDVTEPENLLELPSESYFLPQNLTTARIVIKPYGKEQYAFVISAETDNASLGQIETPYEVIDLPAYAEITVPITSSQILPFDGKVRIGEDVGIGVENILLNANVQIVEKQFFREDRYIAAAFSLDAGDRVTLFQDSSKRQLADTRGFLRMKQSDAFAFTIHGEAEVLRVDRLGSNGYGISPSIWPRLTSDPIMAAISTLLATLFLLMEFTELFTKFISRKKDEDAPITK